MSSVERRPRILAVLRQEGVGRAPPFVAQHTEERPFGVEFGRGAEIGHHLAPDHVDAHARPLRPLGIAGIRDLPQQGDHPQFLQQYGVERYLVQAVEDVTGRTWDPWALDRIDGDEDRVVRHAFRSYGEKMRPKRSSATYAGE
jgi:hypothetical protein